jgi:hypothetical protein
MCSKDHRTIRSILTCTLTLIETLIQKKSCLGTDPAIAKNLTKMN